ncbi:MAG: hypothetical protein RMK32_08995 [Anaerolineae bacterium]|nr:hypothetical protein [Thermoflexus sp.]MDW8065751.1 hypothetical protein [Anaerolineae bacterium]
MAWHGFPNAQPDDPALRSSREERTLGSVGPSPVSEVEIGVPLVIGLMMAGGWLALEWFNYGASEYALTTLFGNLTADGMTWGMLLALGLWLVDLSGLLYFSIPSEREKPGFWYVLVAWLLASGANALLKWWAVTLALMASPLAQPGTPRAALVNAVMPYIPTATAFLVWTGRVLLTSTMMGLLMPALRQLADRIRAWMDSYVARVLETTEETREIAAGPRLIAPEDPETSRRQWIHPR